MFYTSLSYKCEVTIIEESKWRFYERTISNSHNTLWNILKHSLLVSFLLILPVGLEILGSSGIVWDFHNYKVILKSMWVHPQGYKFE